MMNSVLKWAFSAALALFLFLGFAKAVVSPVEISQYEQRYAEQIPPFSWNSFLKGEYQSEMDSGLGDQIAFSPYFKKLYNELFSAADSIFMGLRSSIPDRYVQYHKIALYNGQLVNKPATVQEHRVFMDPSVQIVNELICKLPDTSFYFFYVNNDSDFNFETGESTGIYQYFSQRLQLPANHCDALEVSSFGTLQKLFYRSDHHWNHKGSYRAYCQLLPLLQLDDEPLQPLDEVEVPGKFYGSKTIGVGTTYYYDVLSAYLFPFPPMKISVNGTAIDDYGALEDALSHPKPNVSYAAIYGDDYGCMVLSTENKEKDNLLVIGDSYDNAVLKLLASHFNETHSVDLRYYPYLTGKQFDTAQYVKEHDISKVLLIGGNEFCGTLQGLEN